MTALVGRRAGPGFTHKEGDIVTISSPKLGALALMRNLARRGLL